ncbi:hypothetical protein TNCV_3694071 [Trichonephila clavipes]|nr:hypothetical protein TNCV_3694071 [Trichonephila clavipes]
MLRPVDRRDIIYTATRFRMPSTDQLLRRPSHHTTSRRRANFLIGCYPDTGSTFTRTILPEPSQGAWLKAAIKLLYKLPITPIQNASV